MSVSFIPLGARYMVLSALGFALMGVFVKIAYAHGIPVLDFSINVCLLCLSQYSFC